MEWLTALTRCARYQNDAPTVPDDPGRRAGCKENGVDVLSNRAMPLVIRHLGQSDILRWPYAGVADKNVEGAKLAYCRLDQGLRFSVSRNVPVSYTHLRAHETDSYL